MKTATNVIFTKIESNGNTITEREINILKRRRNNGERDAEPEREYNITESQTIKGKQWILTKLARANGEPRKGCEDCAELIECAKDSESVFTFSGFANIGYFVPFYTPVYTLSNKWRSVSYYLNGGKCVIC